MDVSSFVFLTISSYNQTKNITSHTQSYIGYVYIFSIIYTYLLYKEEIIKNERKWKYKFKNIFALNKKWVRKANQISIFHTNPFQH